MGGSKAKASSKPPAGAGQGANKKAHKKTVIWFFLLIVSSDLLFRLAVSLEIL